MRSPSSGALLSCMCDAEGACCALELQSVTGAGGRAVDQTWEEGASAVFLHGNTRIQSEPGPKTLRSTELTWSLSWVGGPFYFSTEFLGSEFT